MAWNTDRTKALLLAAAVEEFGERGLSGGRVDRIAKRAGVNKERIYQYFQNKEGLFEAALVEMTLVVGEVSLQGHGAAAVGDYVGRLFDRYCEDETLSRLHFWEALEGSPGRANRQDERARTWEYHVDGLMRALPGTERATVEDLLLSMVTICAGWRVVPRRDSLLAAGPAEQDATRRASVVAMFTIIAESMVTRFRGPSEEGARIS